jgi:hypothetical protein
MNRPSISGRFLAVVVAASLATSTGAPLAFAQGKGPAAGAKPTDKKPAGGDKAPAADKPAKAPDKKTRDAARKAYTDGEKSYNGGKYAEAYDQFKKADEILPSPHAQYWMAMALDKQGKKEDAAAAFEKLLANPDVDKIGDDKKSEAKTRLGELKGKQTGELNIVTTPAGASVSVDGQAQPGETPMIIKLPPGAHKVSLSNPGYESQDVSVDVSAGQRVDKNVELKASELAAPVAPPPGGGKPEPAEPPPSEAPPPAKPKSKVPAYVTLGIAGVSAVVGTFFGIKALGAKSDFNDNPTTDKADDVERNALIADMAFGVAITLGVTGIVLLTSSGGESAPAAKESAKRTTRTKLKVLPYAGPTGGGAAALLTF